MLNGGVPAKLLRHPLPLKPEMSLPNLPLVQFQAMRDNQSHRYPAPRVYDSESRNRFCKEYEDYKWFISGMRMMCPDNPLCQIELSEWISIRLAKVECDKAVAIERIRVLVERKKMRERRLCESNGILYKNPTGGRLEGYPKNQSLFIIPMGH